MAHILEQHLVQVLGIDLLSTEEQSVFLSEVGDAIFETAMLRLFGTLNEEEQESLETFLAEEPEPDMLLAHLLEQYTAFSSILESVVYEFKEDAQKALKESDAEIKVVE